MVLMTVLAMSNLSSAQSKPLKVFILAGQSNMEGHAKIETFDYIGDDPATVPLLKQMRGPDGKPTVCEGVWISYLTGRYDGSANGEGTGKLTAGFGARGDKPTQDGGKIGPEFTFGLAMDAAFEEPVLIIKTAWGGKSLHTDFRSPSAGPYELSDWQKEHYPKQEGHGIPKDFEKWKADKAKETGVFYRLMIEHVKRVLADPKRVCPAYDPAAGYEIAGFVWLQGFNDMVDSHVYPQPKKGDPTPRFARYSDCLAHFIRDVRRDLAAPKMPFVIGVMGVGGANPGADILAFREAMAAPASLPEFQGNVIAVQTAPFWSEELGAIADKYDKVRQMSYYLDSKHKDYANADGKMTAEQKREFLKDFEAKLISPSEAALWKRGASNAGYHYLGCAKTFALMGQAFAEAILKMRHAETQASQPGRKASPSANGAAIPRETRDVSGWQVHIHKKLLEDEAADTERALVLLKQMLDAIVRDVPAAAVIDLFRFHATQHPAGEAGQTKVTRGTRAGLMITLNSQMHVRQR
jgi:alpha-galactosidase